MEKLTYDILKEFVFDLDVTNVEVKRLGDDSSEIQLGDEVPFVATASFRLTRGGVDQLRQLKGDLKTEHLAVGDELFVIGVDGHVRSDKVPIDEDSVIRWLADRYEFRFLLNGSEHGPFRSVGQIQVAFDSPERARHELALPWIRKLNTAAIKGDLIDVDVKIDARSQIAQPATPPVTTWQIASIPVVLDGREVFARLEIDSHEPAVHDLIGKTFRVPVESERGRLQFAITFTSNPGAPRATPPPSAESGKSTKS